MNTRFLFIVSLLAAVFAVWFYRSQGEPMVTAYQPATNIEYQATDIVAIQTNVQGLAEYTLKADDLTHYDDRNIDKLTHIVMTWRANGAQRLTLYADTAVMQHDDNKVMMQHNVALTSQRLNDDNAKGRNSQSANSQFIGVPLTLKASRLTGNLNSNRIFSDHPILVSQGSNTFKAASFNADLTTGDYAFNQVETVFQPPKRQDAALF